VRPCSGSEAYGDHARTRLITGAHRLRSSPCRIARGRILPDSRRRSLFEPVDRAVVFLSEGLRKRGRSRVRVPRKDKSGFRRDDKKGGLIPGDVEGWVTGAGPGGLLPSGRLHRLQRRGFHVAAKADFLAIAGGAGAADCAADGSVRERRDGHDGGVDGVFVK